MRCHICDSYTNEVCKVCKMYSCYYCMMDGICKNCLALNLNSYMNQSRVSVIKDNRLFIIGMALIMFGFILIATSHITFNNTINQVTPQTEPKGGTDGFIYIFPFVLIKSPDPLVVVIVTVLFIILPIIAMLWITRYGVRFK